MAITAATTTAAPVAERPPVRFFDEGFLRKLDRLRLVSMKMHGSSSHGGRRSKKRGTSVEFADYREYVLGDDLRQIDWNVYGRSERLFVKLREDEESLGVHLLIDCSKSMDWGRHNKLEFARRLAAALGYIALSSTDRLTCTAFSQRLLSHYPLTRGRGQALRFFQFASRLRAEGGTDLRTALRAYASIHRRSGLAIMLSDLMNPGGLEGLSYLLDRGFEVVLLHVLDLVETDPELHGEVELRDRETGRTVYVSADEVLLAQYRQRLERWIQEIEQFCAKRMVRYVPISTSTPLDDVLFRHLRARKILA